MRNILAPESTKSELNEYTHTHTHETQGSHRHIRAAVAEASVELITARTPDCLDRQFGPHDSGTKSSSAALILTPCSLHPDGNCATHVTLNEGGHSSAQERRCKISPAAPFVCHFITKERGRRICPISFVLR